MNIGTITTAGAKGQIVIPQKIREVLGITADTVLQITLSGNSIAIHPISGVVRLVDREQSYEQILAKTQGSWAGSPDEYQTYRKREKAHAKKMRNAW